MQITVEESKTLEPGTHKGIIEEVSFRDTPYKYTDIHIKIDNQTIKVGYPTQINDKNKLGKLLLRFGAKLEIGTQIDPEIVLKGKHCTFQSITKSTSKGTFPKVIGDSLSPIAEESVK